jgi:polyferredoxin
MIIWWCTDLDADADEIFKSVFPMFRGILLFITYIWLLSWNVYGWTRYNINYKLIFKFNYHFSEVSEVNS